VKEDGMLPERAVDLIDQQQQWLDPTSDTVQQAVHRVFQAGGPAGRLAKNLLHGVWLGHQLHPALTDVPLGAWTTALVLDILAAAGRKELTPGADAAVALGLVGAAGSAVTGLTDWADTDAVPRRVGMLHGLLNTGAALLYGASLVCRRRGDYAAGRGLAALGYAVVLGSAYLGGHLVFAMRIGVDHAAAAEAPEEFTRVMAAAELAENTPTRVEANGVPVLLVRQEGQIYALAETCSHMGGPLAEGQLEGCSVRCPWHGSRFALDDGRVLDGPATNPQPGFAVRVRDGQIEVRAARSADVETGQRLPTGNGLAAMPYSTTTEASAQEAEPGI
jgi:nitrite reductase/ring-hydroxylating ferredoxin subunit/uncharacterized membrane protein